MKIAIVGGGLLGRLFALRLLEQRYTDLTLFDQGPPGNTTSPAHIAAGMLAGLSESVYGGNLIYQLGKGSVALWRSYLKALDAEHLLSEQGSLLLSSAQYAQEAQHYLAKIQFNTQENDFYQVLNSAQIQQLEPELKANQAYWLSSEAAVEAPKLMAGLETFLLPRLNWQWHKKVTIIYPDGLINGVGWSAKYQLVLDCRGLGAKYCYPQLRGVRGEIIRVHAPEVNLSRPIRVFHPRHNFYVVPYAQHNFAIGASEIEAEDFSPVSLRTALELLDGAYRLHPGFAEARITSLDSNCRPTLPESRPQILHQQRIIAINGLARHGYLIAPSLVETVVDFINFGERRFANIWRIL